MPTAQTLAHRIPLGHVTVRGDKISLRDLLCSGFHPTTAPGAVTSGSPGTRAVESKIWGTGKHFVYFYAGRCHHRYGLAAFLHSPAAEAGHSGGATPFDTGAVLSNGYDRSWTEDQQVKYVRDHDVDLSKWRAKMLKFVQAHFASPEEFFSGAPTGYGLKTRDPGCAWIAWCWEVRFAEPHGVDSALIAWAADKDTCDSFADLRDELYPSPLFEKLASLLLPLTVGTDPFAPVNQLARKHALT